MRCAMFTPGGLPIMMGQQVRSESLFYYFKLDDYLPKNHLLRHGRFQASRLFDQLFEEIVRQCVEVGLVQGDHLSVDGSSSRPMPAPAAHRPRASAGSSAGEAHRS